MFFFPKYLTVGFIGNTQRVLERNIPKLLKIALLLTICFSLFQGKKIENKNFLDLIFNF